MLRHNPRLDRLATALDQYERELRGYRQRPVNRPARRLFGPPADERGLQWWRQPADDLLSLAKQRFDQRRIDAAWESLHSSQRLSLYELTDREIAARTRQLRDEVEDKLTGWRQSAALQHLTAQACWPPEDLIAAQRILDDHFTNTYIRLRLAGRRLLLAALLLAAAIAALWVAAWRNAFAAFALGETSVLHNAGQFPAVLALGVFGSMLSLALDSSHLGTRRRIYELASAQFAVPLARLCIGGGSAVLVVAVAQAGVIGLQGPWELLIAVPAGFSERLVRRAVDALETASTANTR